MVSCREQSKRPGLQEDGGLAMGTVGGSGSPCAWGSPACRSPGVPQELSETLGLCSSAEVTDGAGLGSTGARVLRELST